jgi:hypothetical protein
MKKIYKDIRRWIAELLFMQELDEDFNLGYENGIATGKTLAQVPLYNALAAEEEKSKPNKTRIKHLQEALTLIQEH